MEPRAHAFKKTAVFLSKALIVLATVTAFGYALFYFYESARFYFRGNVLLFVLYAFLFIEFASVYNCFQIGVLLFKELVFSYALAAGLTNFAAYCVLCLIARALLPPLPILVLTVAQALLCAGLFRLANGVYFTLYPVRSALFICGPSKSDAALAKKFNRSKKRQFIALVCSESEGFEALAEKINAYPCVVVGSVDSLLRLRLIDYCFDKNKRLYLTPTLQDIMLHFAHDIFIGDSATLLLKNRGLTMEQRIMKRVTDVIFALTGLILTCPVMLLTALAIKAGDGGAVFYRQKRLTQDGRVFTILKFRSMREDAEKRSGAQLAKKNDARVTGVGRLIRPTRIDELPQLINVLKGEMSVVGPRPERPEIFEKIANEFPQFAYRLKVKAGLTGYAQIYGKYSTTFEEKVKMDLIYIEHCSLLLDLKIMLSTLKVLLVRESAEGVEPAGAASVERKK